MLLNLNKVYENLIGKKIKTVEDDAKGEILNNKKFRVKSSVIHLVKDVKKEGNIAQLIEKLDR